MEYNNRAFRIILCLSVSLIFCNKFVEPDKAPVAEANGTGEYFFTDTIYLDASKSYDPEGRQLTYIWDPPNTLPFVEFIDSLPQHRFLGLPKGTYIFTLTVFNGIYYSRPAQCTLRVNGADIVVSQDPGRFFGFKTIYGNLRLALPHAKSGDTIYIDQGTYDDSVFIDSSNVFIYGPLSRTAILDGSKYSYAPITISGATNVTLRNLVVRGGKEVGDCGGVVIENSDNILLENCRITQNRTDGVHVSNSGNRGKIRIDSCLIDSNRYSGVLCMGSSISATNCIFNNNVMVNSNTDTAKDIATITLWEADSNVTLLSNKFTNSRNLQILIRKSSTLEARYNVFDSVYMGMYLPTQCGATVSMSNNRFNHVESHCIWCDSASAADFTTNQDTLSSTKTPIWCDGAKTISIRNDMIVCGASPNHDITQKGIDLGGCDTGVIAGTTIKGYLIGIILNQSPVSLSGNTFMNDSVCLCNLSADKPPDLTGTKDWSGCKIDTTSIYNVQ
jgi:parallel beta-helix repeat protein